MRMAVELGQALDWSICYGGSLGWLAAISNWEMSYTLGQMVTTKEPQAGMIMNRKW